MCTNTPRNESALTLRFILPNPTSATIIANETYQIALSNQFDTHTIGIFLYASAGSFLPAHIDSPFTQIGPCSMQSVTSTQILPLWTSMSLRWQAPPERGFGAVVFSLIGIHSRNSTDLFNAVCDYSAITINLTEADVAQFTIKGALPVALPPCNAVKDNWQRCFDAHSRCADTNCACLNSHVSCLSNIEPECVPNVGSQIADLLSQCLESDCQCNDLHSQPMCIDERAAIDTCYNYARACEESRFDTDARSNCTCSASALACLAPLKSTCAQSLRFETEAACATEVCESLCANGLFVGNGADREILPGLTIAQLLVYAILPVLLVVLAASATVFIMFKGKQRSWLVCGGLALLGIAPGIVYRIVTVPDGRIEDVPLLRNNNNAVERRRWFPRIGRSPAGARAYVQFTFYGFTKKVRTEFDAADATVGMFLEIFLVAYRHHAGAGASPIIGSELSLVNGYCQNVAQNTTAASLGDDAKARIFTVMSRQDEDGLDLQFQ